MDFGEVITRAWNIIWKHKILWLFGFLAGMGGSSGGNSGGGSSGINFRGDANPNFNFDGFENMPQWLQRFTERVPVWLPIVLVLLVLVLIVIVVVLSTFGRIGLTRGAWLADEGELHLGLGQLWGYGSRYFWRVLLLSLILLGISLVVGLIVLIPVIGISILTLGIGLLCLLPLLCVVGIAASLFSVIFDLAGVAIVNEDLDVMDGLRRGWNVFKSHLGEMIGMAVILWIVSMAIGFVLALPVLLIVAPMIASAFFESRMAFGGGTLVSLVLFLLYLPVLLVAGGILQSYIGTAWTLVFRRLTGRPALTTHLA